MTEATIGRIEKMLSSQISWGDLTELTHLVPVIDRQELIHLVRTKPPIESAMLFRVLGKNDALAVFENLTPAYQAELISALRQPKVAEIIEGLDPDDRAELFGELPAGIVHKLMHGLDATARQMTTQVLGYPKSAIGRYMSPEVLDLHDDWTVKQAVDLVYAHIDSPETVYLLPAVGAGRTLTGVVSLRNLIAEQTRNPNQTIGNIARESVSVHALTDREEAAREFLAHRLIAMPIVDEEERLVGILTMDDVLDITDEENAEDTARAGGSEPLDRSYLSSTILRIVRSRIVWLFVLAVSAVLTVQVLEIYEDRLDQVVVLALFIPLLTGTGGNTGNQAATTVT